jgi:hypothetical protein
MVDGVLAFRRLLLGSFVAIAVAVAATQTIVHAATCCVQCSCVQMCCSNDGCQSGGVLCDPQQGHCVAVCDDLPAFHDYCSWHCG